MLAGIVYTTIHELVYKMPKQLKKESELIDHGYMVKGYK